MKKRLFFCVLVIAVLTGSPSNPVFGANTVKMTVVYDNYVHQEGTTADWGFACFIEGYEETILFDTGYNGGILLGNIDFLNVDLDRLDVVVLSHNHADHTGGLGSVLSRAPHITAYMGISYAHTRSPFISAVGGTTIAVDESVEICEHVYSTGELEGPVYEQSLILDTDEGLVVVTGCSHPGIVNILHRAKEVLDKDIYLVFGGFHLGAHSDAEVDQIIQEFQALGVEYCGCTHCTGDHQISLFEEVYGDHFVPLGTGKVIEVSIQNISSHDSDNDGVLDENDNCPTHENPDQGDSDSDDVGDVCDNCPDEYNPGQTDADEDGSGDVCDICTDTDGDDYGNPGYESNACEEDNCPHMNNPEQASVERGNIDCRDGIDVLDALATVNHILGTDSLADAPYDRADCNADGIVDILDVLGIVNVILGTGACAS
ncbi:MAG: MBL fold metallo-hydrolase [Gemmatimonadota bacterium]|nr:MAG: MBL fold metallo-hydrolase [Gemmatimonadota bacterium]